MRIESPAFENNGSIPARYTCDASRVNPPLRFIDPPRGTRSLVLRQRQCAIWPMGAARPIKPTGPGPTEDWLGIVAQWLHSIWHSAHTGAITR